MGRSSPRWRLSCQQTSPRTDTPMCYPVSAAPPSPPGGISQGSVQGQAHLASLPGPVPGSFPGSRTLEMGSVSIFLLETQGLKVEAGLSHHPAHPAPPAVLGEPSPGWAPPGHQRGSMSFTGGPHGPSSVCQCPASPAGRQCPPLWGEGAWQSTEPACRSC